MKIVDHWFDYRKAEPGGRKSSPLDEIQPAEWPHEWNTELLQLLTVLRRLTDLEPRQADLLLDQILDGPLLLLGDLTGVFPVDKRDRTPRLSLHDADAEAGGLLL